MPESERECQWTRGDGPSTVLHLPVVSFRVSPAIVYSLFSVNVAVDPEVVLGIRSVANTLGSVQRRVEMYS